MSTQIKGFVFPGLSVKELGEISYPINPLQAKALIQVARKAPFGKGSETILDNTVRSAWEIDAGQLSFNGLQWSKFINTALTKVKEDLGLEDYSISANLYKLLIYEEGDFFLPHKDSAKKGMFGTMVVGLPSRYTGGELVVRFDGIMETTDFSKTAADYKISISAFYADCDHEIKLLTSGYRVCLVYNLVQEKAGKEIEYSSIANPTKQLAKLFREQHLFEDVKPHIILLGHQYTPENFSYNTLKLNDRPKAEALLQAARQAGCYAKLCLVTSFKSGAPEYDGYYDEDVNDDAEIAEIYDEWLTIEHWAKSDTPGFSDVSFEEEDLIVSFTLDEDEPIIKESTGYTGNYGPDINHWYHYGAVMVWTKLVNATLFLTQDTVSKLNWVQYFCNNPQQISKDEVNAVNFVLRQGVVKAPAKQQANYNAIANWVVITNDKDFFANTHINALKLYFTQIDLEYWFKLFDFGGEENAKIFFKQVMYEASLEVIEQLVGLLNLLVKKKQFEVLAIQQINKLPLYFETYLQTLKANGIYLNAAALQNLFNINSSNTQAETWVNEMVSVLATFKKRSYINGVLVPTLLALPKPNPLSQKLLLACKEYFEHIANNPPQAPANWAKAVPATGNHKKQWEILRSFLESATEQAFDYRKNQHERNEMESAIGNVEIDLKTETIKKGTPHTLRITKTQAAYNKKVKEWNEDTALFKEIMVK